MSIVSSTSERCWLFSVLLMALAVGCAGSEAGRSMPLLDRPNFMRLLGSNN